MSILRSRQGVTQGYALGFMILAFVLIGGFMYWLKVASESSEVQVSPEAVADTAGAGGGTRVMGADFGASPSSYFEREIVLAGVRHSGSLSDQVFWGSVAEARLLVRFDPMSLAAGTELSGGDQLLLTGVARAMNDSVMAAWIAEGLADEGDRIELNIAEIYFEASAIQKSGIPGAGTPDSAAVESGGDAGA